MTDGVGLVAEVPGAVEQVAGLDGGHPLPLDGIGAAADQPAHHPAPVLGPVPIREQGGQHVGEQPVLLAQSGPLPAHRLERLLGFLLAAVGQLELAAGEPQGLVELGDVRGVGRAHGRPAMAAVSSLMDWLLPKRSWVWHLCLSLGEEQTSAIAEGVLDPVLESSDAVGE